MTHYPLHCANCGMGSDDLDELQEHVKTCKEESVYELDARERAVDRSWEVNL